MCGVPKSNRQSAATAEEKRGENERMRESEFSERGEILCAGGRPAEETAAAAHTAARKCRKANSIAACSVTRAAAAALHLGSQFDLTFYWLFAGARPFGLPVWAPVWASEAKVA